MILPEILRVSKQKRDRPLCCISESLNEIIQNVSKIRSAILPPEKTRESTNFIYHALQGDRITILTL
jgi:hypothetical protein